MTVQSLKTFNNFSTHSEKRSHLFTCMAHKFPLAWPLFTYLQLFPILGPLSMLFLLSRMFFPTPHLLSSFSPLIFKLNLIVLEKLFLDPLDLKLDPSTSSHSRPSVFMRSCCSAQLVPQFAIIYLHLLLKYLSPILDCKFHDNRNYV